MLTSLRKRPRADALKTEQRRVTNRTGRAVYFSMLVAFFIAGLNFLIGDMVFFGADGLVIRDKSTVATTYLARVEAVNVKSGTLVANGDRLIKFQSMEVLERLADLSSRNASLAAQAAEFAVRSETISKLLPLAERREAETAKVLSRFDRLSDVKLVTSVRYDEALKARFDAQQSLVNFQAQDRALRSELTALVAARLDAEAALADLRRQYADGVVNAPVTGAIGPIVPSVGDVYRPGEKIMEIYSGDPYVLAYLPRRYLFDIEIGAGVTVSSGRIEADGVIIDILPVTDSLPKEFQNTFKPQARNQLARIQLSSAAAFPLHEKVHIAGKTEYSFDVIVDVRRWFDELFGTDADQRTAELRKLSR